MRITPFQFSAFDVPPSSLYDGEQAHAGRPLEALRRVNGHLNGVALAEPAPPPPLTYTEEELVAKVEEARRASYEEGYAAGEQKAHTVRDATEAKQKREHDAACTQAMQQIVKEVLTLHGAQQEFFARQEEPLSAIALAIGRKLAGAALKKEPLAEIQRIVQECLASLMGEVAITVTVSEAFVNPVRQWLTREADEETQALVTVQGSNEIVPGDCRVEWPHGQAERDSEQLWQAILETVQQYASLLVQSQAEGGRDRKPNLYVAK